MQKEFITGKQAVCIFTLFITGTTLILGTGGEAKNDAWLAGIVGILMALPMMLIYLRIQSLFPEKNFFDIMELSLGKPAGKAVTLIYILYAFHLGAMVLRNFGEFINTVAMPETPLFVPLLFLGVVCIAGVRIGIEGIGRFCTIFLPIVLIILVLVQLFALHQFELSNLKPFLGGGLAPVLRGGFATFSFPFAETVLFLGILWSVRSGKSNTKIFLTSVAIAGVIVIFLTIRNITVLGGGMLSILYFPSYTAVGLVAFQDYIERMEVTVSIVFIFGAMIKSTVCLYFAGKGLSRLVNIEDYRPLVIQLGLLMIYFSYTVYNNIEEMRYWAFKVYPYYAFPVQVIFPVLIWLCAEVKNKRLAQGQPQAEAEG